MKKKVLKWGLIIVGVVVGLFIVLILMSNPKTILRRDSDKIESIMIFDGTTGNALVVKDKEKINKIRDYIDEMQCKIDGISIGKMGYGYRITFEPGIGMLDSFIINSEDMLRSDPFFYQLDKPVGLHDYIDELYSGNLSKE